MENFIFKVDRTLNPNKLYDEELFFDEIEQEYLPPNRVYRGGRWVTAKDGSRSYQNNGAPNIYRTVSMGLYLQLHKMYFMLLKAALIPESFGDDDESRAIGRAFITEMQQIENWQVIVEHFFVLGIKRRLLIKEIRTDQK